MLDLRKVFAAVGRTVQAHPVLTLVAALVLVGVAVGGASQITSVTGNEAFVGDDPTLEAYGESFDRSTIATLVRGSVTEPATMRAIDRYDRRVSAVEDVERVVSPADAVRSEYGRIPDSRAKIARVVDDSGSAVVTTILEPGLTQSQTRPVYTESVDAEEWARFPSGVSVTITGSAAFSAQLSELIQSSTQQLLGLAVGLMVVALFFLFRGVRLRLLPIVAVFSGVIYTFGAIGYAGVPNSTLTSSVFPILIGLGIDYSVQFHERYEEELETNPPREALPLALGGIGPPVLVAMLAAALGFGATWVSTRGTPAFVWFAQTSIFGVLLTFLAGLIVLVPILTLYARWRDSTADDGAGEPSGGVSPSGDPGGSAGPDSEEIGRLGRVLGRTTRFVAAHPLAVLSVAIVLMAGGFAVSSDLGTMADTEEFIPQDLPAYVDLQEFRSVSGGGAAVRYDVLVTGSQLRHPEVLRWMERYEGVATGKPLITGVETPATLVERYNGGTIPETTAGVERAVERAPEIEVRRFYADGRAHITVFGAQNMNTEQVLSFLDNVEGATELSRPPPGVDATLTGTAAVSTPAIVEQIEERNVTTALGVLFVFALLLAYYRNLLRAVAPLVPMVFVIGWQNLYMAVLSIPVSPLGAGLGALTVGIGAEYTIIVMERYFEETGRGVPRLDAVETAGARVGKAITVSGMTTVFGFSALTLSPFPITADFGSLTVGVIFLTLVAAITTLPPTLIVLGRVSDAVDALLGRGDATEPAPAGDD
jgi:hydrophobe/amphiphile efflux-3 (HAE3) family protein